jgi:hypothetical protein
MHIGYWWGKPEGNRKLGKPKLGGLIIFRWIMERYGAVVWTESVCLRIGTIEGLL